MDHEFEREIRNLQKKLDDEKLRMDKELKEQKALFQRQLEACDKKLSNYVKKQKEDLESSFLERAQSLQRETDQLLDEYIARQRETEKQYQEQQRLIIDKIKALCEENKKKIISLEGQLEQREEYAREAYDEASGRLNAIERQVKDEPFRILLGRTPDFDTGREAIKRMLLKKMYETAAGHTDHIVMEYELLLNEIDIKVKEWETEFHYFNTLVQVLSDRFRTFDQMPLDTPYSSGVIMSEEEKDFWSQGEYGKIRRLLEDATTLATDISCMGMKNYLMAHKDESIEPMLDQYLRVRRWKNRVYALIRAVTNERYYSDQRYVWGDNIISSMERAGYILLDASWEEASISMQEKEWYQLTHPDSTLPENQLGYYCLVFGFGEGDTVSIYIVPEREHGVVEKNTIHINVKMNSSCEEESKKEILGDAEAIVFAAAKTNAIGHQQRNQSQPSVEEQVKFLNLSYGEGQVKA